MTQETGERKGPATGAFEAENTGSDGHANPEKYEISYGTLREKDLEQAIECIVESFKDEPMTKVFGIAPDELHHFAGVFAKKAVNEGLSTVARDEATGKVVGVCISEDLVSELSEGMGKLHAKLYPITALLSKLDEEYKKSRPHEIGKGDVLRLFLGAVRESHRRQGTLTTLANESLKSAKLKGFSCAIAEATGSFSQHVLRDKLGFAEKFAYEEERVFEGIETSRTYILMERRL